LPSDAVPSYPAFASVESRVCFWCGTVLLCGCAVERLLAGGSRWILTMNRACRTVPLLVLSSSRVRGWDSVVESHCVTQVQQASPVLPCLKEQCIGVMLDKAITSAHILLRVGCVVYEGVSRDECQQRSRVSMDVLQIGEKQRRKAPPKKNKLESHERRSGNRYQHRRRHGRRSGSSSQHRRLRRSGE
jgi:hypothetical protein